LSDNLFKNGVFVYQFAVGQATNCGKGRPTAAKNNTVTDDYVSVKLFWSKKGAGHDFFIYS